MSVHGDGMREIIEDPYRVSITYNIEENSLKKTPKFFQDRDEKNGGEIITGIPDDGYSSSAASSWDAPLDEGGDELSAIAQFVGVGVSNKVAEFAKQVWTGSDPVSVTLNLRFITVNSPKNDVFFNAKALELLCMPGSGAGPGELFLRPPIVRGEDRVTVKIGNHIEYPFVIPQGADVSFNRAMTREPGGSIAYPTIADVSFSFLTSEIPIRRSYIANKVGDVGFEVEG